MGELWFDVALDVEKRDDELARLPSRLLLVLLLVLPSWLLLLLVALVVEEARLVVLGLLLCDHF